MTHFFKHPFTKPDHMLGLKTSSTSLREWNPSRVCSLSVMELNYKRNKRQKLVLSSV